MNVRMKKIFYFAIVLIVCLFSGNANAQQVSRLTNLPHMIIDTYERKPIYSKEEYIYSKITLIDEDDNVQVFDSTQIRGRGNSTWNMSKKPYKIKFQKKQKLLGKGYANAKTWTLLANAGDKTLFRNALTSLMGDFLGLKNNPAHKFVDLTLNGTYLGTYQISDQVEVRPHRVNVVEQDYPLTENSNITGGYLLEVDGFHDGNCFATNNWVYVRIHYPEEEEIDAKQNTYIRNYVNTFERALMSTNFKDPIKGYRQYVDSVSLANWFLVTEITANIDGYYSTYFYKNQDDPLIYWGPIWDYDIAYNNDRRIPNTQTRLMDEEGYGDAKKWVGRMWQDPWFGSLVNRRFDEIVKAGIEDYLYQQIDSLAELLDESKSLNYAKWGISTRMYNEIVLYSSYNQYVNDVKSFIRSHIAFLKDALYNKWVDAPEPVFEPENYWYRIANSNTGNYLDTEGRAVCTWSSVDERDTQLWRFVLVSDGQYVIVNKATGLALCDPTVGVSTATTNVGTQLSVAELDYSDNRQYWQVVMQGRNGRCNLVNVATEHTINLSGGATHNGASVLSYTTDERNSSSANRLWNILPVEKYVDPNAIASAEPEEYALALDKQNGVLHFGSATPEMLTFVVNMYSANGSLVRTFKADERCGVSDLPSGVYVITWNVDGKRRSVKVRL